MRSRGGPVRNSRKRTAYLLESSLVRLSFQHERIYLWTLTNREPISDIERVKRMARPLQDWLRRHGATAAGCWEPQPKRSKVAGAPIWHLHFMTDFRIDVNWFRPWLAARGWGNPDVVRVTETLRYKMEGGCDPRTIPYDQRAARYLCKYLHKEIEGVPAHKPLVWYVNGAKCGSVRFNWTGGLARAWRVGLPEWLRLMGTDDRPAPYSAFRRERRRRRDLGRRTGNNYLRELIHHVLRLGCGKLGEPLPPEILPQEHDLLPGPARAGPQPEADLFQRN